MDIEALAAEAGIETDDIPDLFSELAIGAYKRYMQTGSRDDISEAIDWAKQGIHLTRDKNLLLTQWLSNLELFLESRYERTGEIKDLEEAIETAKRAVESTPADHPNRAGMLHNLGNNLGLRYKRTRDMDDLKEAIEMATRAVESTPADHPHLAVRLHNLGTKLGLRYERTREMDDLKEAIKTARRAVESTPDDHPDLAGRSNNLGVFLECRYERTEDMKDLEEAIKIARQAVESTPDDHPDLAARSNNLGNMLGLRYDRTGEMKDLEEATQTARQAVDLASDDHPDMAAMLHNLGSMLQRRYKRTGGLRDLEQAIKTARRAVQSAPDDHPDLAAILHNLGNNLGLRYERTGEMRNLEEAIKTARRAVKSTPDDYPDLAVRLHNLGNKLSLLYERTREMDDLKEAIKTARRAVESTPDDHPDLAARSNNLGIMLGLRYERTRDMDDLKEAIKTARRAVELTSDDHPDRAGMLHNLGNKLSLLYERTREMNDLKEAIKTARRAVKSTSDDHPDLAAMLHNLGTKLVLRYGRTGEMTDLEEASTYLLEAWSCLNAVPFHRITAAAQCLELLATQNRADEGIDLGRRILDLLPSVHTRALDRNDQQFVMSTFAGVASYLCSFLLSANRLNEALECLERGRAIIISQMLDDRSDLSSLRQGHSQLAKRYQSLVDEVNAPTSQATLGVVEALLQKRRQEAVAQLDMCLKEIRCVPGHERFMLGQTIAEMQECITEGSIVVINITDFRSDAIIISSNSLKTIILPELSASKARSWLSKDWSTRKKSEQRGKNDQFLDYLSWLWHACVKHVIAEISASQTHTSQSLPRVWWIGSGLASSMPFHAAGVHRRGSKENAYCTMISSYTPSIKALTYAQKQAKRAHKQSRQGIPWAWWIGSGLVGSMLFHAAGMYQGGSAENAYGQIMSFYPPSTKTLAKRALEALESQDLILIVAMPTSPKGSANKKPPKDLPGVKKETEEILNAARSRLRTTDLIHPSADQVMQVLKKCRIVHFACHGISDYSDPSKSGLILQKNTGSGKVLVQDRLTVRQVSELRLRYAQIAYLSACSTAENKTARLSDEVIHVVSGFQVAGFPHVVGCLWSAGDSECVKVAKRFYSLVLPQNLSVISNEVASALHEAVMTVRAEDLDMPLNWAQFVHYGA